jgi:hypothetical protein
MSSRVPRFTCKVHSGTPRQNFRRSSDPRQRLCRILLSPLPEPHARLHVHLISLTEPLSPCAVSSPLLFFSHPCLHMFPFPFTCLSCVLLALTRLSIKRDSPSSYARVPSLIFVPVSLLFHPVSFPTTRLRPIILYHTCSTKGSTCT